MVDFLQGFSVLKIAVYYRLEIVDKDGSKTYSDVKQIRLNESTDKRINIYPNPAKTTVNIECAGAKEITITDYLGKIVYQSTRKLTSYSVHLTSYIKGIYIVKATMNNGEIKIEKLVIE